MTEKLENISCSLVMEFYTFCFESTGNCNIGELKLEFTYWYLRNIFIGVMFPEKCEKFASKLLCLWKHNHRIHQYFSEVYFWGGGFAPSYNSTILEITSGWTINKKHFFSSERMGDYKGNLSIKSSILKINN